MKLEDLKSVEVKAIEVPAKIPVPPFANSDRLADRIFGALCRINPELPCMEDNVFLKRVFTCISSAGGDEYLPTTKDVGSHMNPDYVDWLKTNKTVAKWRKWYAEEKERKTAYNNAHTEERKKDSESRKEKYGFAIVNGEPDAFATGYALEPEGIYAGRGDSPAAGYWKVATEPVDVVVNTNSKNLPIILEVQPDGSRVEKTFKWNTKWDPTAHVAATYTVQTGIPTADGTLKKVVKTSYKGFAFSSTRKEGQEKKYAAGAELGKAYNAILKQVDSDLTKEVNVNTAIAVFLLFEKGIRIGSKSATENGTKGLLSLVWGKDVKRSGNKIKFDFLGKDSVRDTSVVETKYAEIIEKHWNDTRKLDTTKEQIEAYVKNIAPDVTTFTPKLARTAVACATALNALEEMTTKFKVTKESPIALKKLAFDEATMLVARRLNHQRGVNKVAEEKRKAKFKESENKLKERKAKLDEQISEKEKRIAALKAKGDKEKVKVLREQIQKAKDKFKQAEMNLDSKERNQNFANSTCKASYIDPSIVYEWSKRIEMPIEKLYTKAQLKAFDFAINQEGK